MADIVKSKNCRKQAKANYTRASNVLKDLIGLSSSPELVNKQFNKAMDCYDKLEAAHDEFIAITDIDIDTDKDGLAYIEEVGKCHTELISSVATFLKDAKTVEDSEIKKAAEDKKTAKEARIKAEAQERLATEEKLRFDKLNARFESGKTEIDLLIDTFNEMHANTEESLKDSSDHVKREEWGKVENDFKALLLKFVTFSAIDPTKDIGVIKTKFEKNAHQPFIAIQKWILEQQKTASNTSGGSSSSSSTASSTTTRRETVNLPTFKGDESGSPFLEFPIWKKSWDSLIPDYEERFHYRLLAEHLDDAAKSKFVGSENDYATAMKKLQLYYGDISKVVKCVVRDVMSQSTISEGQYGALVSYSDTLENNYNRLLSLEKGLEHEMSNSSAMSTIMIKFPRNVREKWEEYLIQQESDVKLKPFSEFIAWLSSQREIWQRMASTEISCSSGDCSQFGFYGNISNSNEKVCYTCGEKGHLKRECPKKRENKVKKTRDPLKIKKFWCALHRDEANRSCESISCQELRRLQPNERLRLLKENNDCKHCCRDHKPENCTNKERICGGGKENRGCTKNHKLHELFCSEAKVFSIQCVHAADTTSGGTSETVVLLIMTVRMLRKGQSASVFWDTGCTSNFICDAFAKLCGFRGEEVTLCVTTLGGVVTDYKTVISYKCSFLDADGYIHYFEAYGMSTITGSVSKINLNKLKQLFPNCSDELLNSLERGLDVDILMGLGEASWHPERDQKAKDGGDLWIYRNMFGACVGGRHPNVLEKTRRNQELFYVNHVYLAMVSQKCEPISHELEFCPGRVKGVALNDTLEKSVREVTVGYTPVKIGREVMGCVLSDGVIPGAPTVSTSTLYPLADEYTPTTSVIVTSPKESEGNKLSNLPIAISVVTEKWIEDVKTHCVFCNVALTSPFGSEELFFKADSLGTVVQPMCGDCKCSKCPVPESKYSYSYNKDSTSSIKIYFAKMVRTDGIPHIHGPTVETFFQRMIKMHCKVSCL